MKIETITYKRIKNLGNYQDVSEAVAKELKAFIYNQLYQPDVEDDFYE